MARKPAKRKTASRKSSTKRKTTRKAASRSAQGSSKKRTAPKKAAKPEPKKIVKSRKVTAPRNNSTKSFTQSEFIENIRSFCGLEKRSEAKELWEDISELLTQSLKKGYKVPLAGLGKMYVRKTKARMGRNPATGEPIHIPAKKRIRFTASKALKEAVL